MRVKVEVTANGSDMTGVYEGESVLFVQSSEKINGSYVQAPALIVLLDTGEFKVQPLIIEGGHVQVFDVNKINEFKKAFTPNIDLNPTCGSIKPEKEARPDGIVEFMSDADIPSYQCHKVVKASKIVKILILKGEMFVDIHLECFKGYVQFKKTFSIEWFNKFKPQLGGYLVIYEDGYISYSPAEPFEAGYTLIEE